MINSLIDIKEILPKESYVGENIIIESKKENILVYYITKYPTGQPKSAKFQPAKTLIPKHIKLSKELVQSLGMYQGDGQKSTKSKSYQSTRFSNSEPKLLNHFLEFLKIFNIPDEKLYFNLRISKNTKCSEDYLRKYWSKILNIPIQNFYKIQWRENKYKYSRVATYGTLTIIYSNSSFRLVIDSLLKYIKNNALKNNSIAMNFLKGLIAADGNVYSNLSNTSRSVNIAAKPDEDRIFINKLFYNLNIITNKDNLTKGKESVNITGYPNLKIMEKYTLCNLHPKKEKKFDEMIKSYKNKCRRKGTSLPLILNLLKEPLTANQLAQKINRKHTSVRRYLYILEKQSKIKRIKTNLHEKPIGRIPERYTSKNTNS